MWNKQGLEKLGNFQPEILGSHSKLCALQKELLMSGEDAVRAPRILFRTQELLYCKILVCVFYSLTVYFLNL